MLVLLTEQLIPKLEKGYGNRVYRISNRTIGIKFRVYNKAGAGEGGEMEGGGGGVDRNKLWFIKNQRDTDFLYFTTECERSEKCSKVAPELRRMQTLTVPSSNNLL